MREYKNEKMKPIAELFKPKLKIMFYGSKFMNVSPIPTNPILQ